MKRSKTLIKRSKTVRNGHTVQDHGPERSRNHGHGMVTLTHQKLKKHYNVLKLLNRNKNLQNYFRKIIRVFFIFA
jgi:hypothetical protein